MNDNKTEVVFLFDLDDTLLDNDRIIADFRHELEGKLGREGARRYWALNEDLRSTKGYVDYLGALQLYHEDYPHDSAILAAGALLLEYPFSQRLYPDAIKVIEHVSQWGPPAILSDGDAVYQPRKIVGSGLFEAVCGRVLIYRHKEQELAEVMRRYPAEHYVLVEDKLRILAAVKAIWGQRVTTVFVRQGHYANDPEIAAQYPPADISLDSIGELLRYDRAQLLVR